MALSIIPRRPESAPTLSPHPAPDRGDPIPFWLSGLPAVLLVGATLAGLFVDGLYRDPPDWVAQTRATDLVTLVVGVPCLVTCMILAVRGSARVQVARLGVLAYIMYMYAIYVFDVAFNPLFLVYVAVLAIAAWSFAILLVRTDVAAFRARVMPGLPVRSTALYLLIVAVLFFLAWMKDIIPAVIGNGIPASLENTHVLTNPVEALDLAFLLPLATLSGMWLWQRRPWGYLLAGITLTTMTIVGVSIVVDMLFERIVDPGISLGMVPLFGLVTLTGLVLLVVYYRNLQSGPPPEPH